MSSGRPPLDRSLFPVTDTCAYLNHATICAPPSPAVDAATAFNAHAARTGGLGFLERVDAVRPARDRLAGLLGGDPSGLALTKNTTEAVSWLVHGLDWAPGDRVLVPANDFPSLRLPLLALQRRGVTVHELGSSSSDGTVPLESWEEALDEGPVRLAASSWIESTAGGRTDPGALARLCHDRGALLCLDVIQGLGIVPTDVARWGVDAVVGGSHKWLLAPEGTGYLWATSELASTLAVSEPGWRWMGHEATEAAFAPADAGDRHASRLEGGTLNGAGLAGLLAAVELLTGAGVDRCWSHVDSLCDRLCNGLDALGVLVRSDRSDAARSAIVSFVLPDRGPTEVVEGLAELGVAVSSRAGGVRVSPHGFNTTEDIDLLLDGLGALMRQTPRS